MQLPSLSPVNEATDGSFWGSGPKVCHEKEANVNALSRNKQLHSPMSWDMSVKAKQTGVFLRGIRARIGRAAKVSEGAEAPCVSQAQVHPQKDTRRNQCLRNKLRKMPLQNMHLPEDPIPDYPRIPQILPSQEETFPLPSSPGLATADWNGKKGSGAIYIVQRGPEGSEKGKGPAGDTIYQHGFAPCSVLASQLLSHSTVTAAVTKPMAAPNEKAPRPRSVLWPLSWSATEIPAFPPFPSLSQSSPQSVYGVTEDPQFRLLG